MAFRWGSENKGTKGHHHHNHQHQGQHLNVGGASMPSALTTAASSASKTQQILHQQHVKGGGKEQQEFIVSSLKKPSVNDLDDGQLKALLEEAVNYKLPSDKEGSSELFKTLLTDAEDDLRKQHALDASGPARYYNTTANKRHRQYNSKRQPSSSSASESVLAHGGGSLNDLTKEELYYESVVAKTLRRPKKPHHTVSARGREGGSLPCNVNAGAAHYDKQFFDEEQAKRKSTKKKFQAGGVVGEYVALDMEADPLIENDYNQNYHAMEEEVQKEMEKDEKQQQQRLMIAKTFTSEAKIDVDQAVNFPFENFAKTSLFNSAYPTQINLVSSTYKHHTSEYLSSVAGPLKSQEALVEHRIDENGNALQNNHQQQQENSKGKRKKNSKRGSEDVIKAEDVKGHRADIINDIDQLVSFIDGTDDKNKSSGNQKKFKVLSKGGNNNNSKKQAVKKASMQKSNSLEEISSTKLDFNDTNNVEENVKKSQLRVTKSNADQLAKSSWIQQLGNAEQKTFGSSTENLMDTEFTYVTKKKKSKKRRNSLGSRSKQVSSLVSSDEKKRPAEFHRVPSPRRRRKGASSSAPHSDKSTSTDEDDEEEEEEDDGSVRSLPDGDQAKKHHHQPHQVSYADIARSVDRPKWNRPPSERKMQAAFLACEKTQQEDANPQTNCVQQEAEVVLVNKSVNTDLSSMQSWPEIRNNNNNNNNGGNGNNKNGAEVVVDWPTVVTNTTTTTNAGVDTKKQLNKPKSAISSVINNSINNCALKPSAGAVVGKVKCNDSSSLSSSATDKETDSKGSTFETITNEVCAENLLDNCARKCENGSMPKCGENILKCGENVKKDGAHLCHLKSKESGQKRVAEIDCSNSSRNVAAEQQPYYLSSSNNNISNNAKSAQKGGAVAVETTSSAVDIASGKSGVETTNPARNNNSAGVENAALAVESVSQRGAATTDAFLLHKDGGGKQVPSAKQQVPVNVQKTENVIKQVSEQNLNLFQHKLPLNIRDVQSIEKMQLKSLQQQQKHEENDNKHHLQNNNINNNGGNSVHHHGNQQHQQQQRPAVIMNHSSDGKELLDLDITFGFDIDKYLLCDQQQEQNTFSVYDEFLSRFYFPPEPTHSIHSDRLINYIGNEWFDTLQQTNSGKVKYYEEEL